MSLANSGRIAARYVLPGVIGAYVTYKVFVNARDMFFARLIGRKSHEHDAVFKHYKEKLFGNLQSYQNSLGRPLVILEIGVGTGANFQYYPSGTEVITVEKNKYMASGLQKNVEKNNHILLKQTLWSNADHMPNIADSSVDVVVCTHVMCGMGQNQIRTVCEEVQRVLRKGGTFLILEHVHSHHHGDKTSILQTLLSPVLMLLTGGGRLTGEPWKVLEDCGYSDVKIEKFDIDSNKCSSLIAPHMMATLTK